MPIFTLITSIGALPKPTILLRREPDMIYEPYIIHFFFNLTLLSSASTKNLQTMSVALACVAPCFVLMTSSSFSWSQSSIVSAQKVVQTHCWK